MKKNVLVFGLIAGVISSLWFIGQTLSGTHADFDNGMLIGYASMLVAFSMIIVAIKKYRDTQNGGGISFGRALSIGLLVSFIASTFYVLVWLVYYYTIGTDFMDQYAAYIMDQLRESGATQAMIEAQQKEMREFAEMYKNPLFVALFTYMEILPVGILVSLIAALVMKRKSKAVVEN